MAVEESTRRGSRRSVNVKKLGPRTTRHEAELEEEWSASQRSHVTLSKPTWTNQLCTESRCDIHLGLPTATRTIELD